MIIYAYSYNKKNQGNEYPIELTRVKGPIPQARGVTGGAVDKRYSTVY